LPARPLEEHDEPARYEESETTAMVFLDQRESEVDGRGHAGRTEYRTVPHKDSIGLDRDVGIGGGKALGILPVRGGASSGEQPDMGQQEGAGTGRPVTPRPLGLISKPLRHLLGRLTRHAVRSDDDQRVGSLSRLPNAGIRNEGHAGRATNWKTILGHQPDPVRPVLRRTTVRLEKRVPHAGDL
jgi:hypothetical protein